MCGIIHVKRLDGKKALKTVAKRYRHQKYRGQEGFGYVAIDDGFMTEYKRSQEEHQIMAEMRKQTANEIMFHHRMPTSAPNFAETAHPIHVSHASLAHDYYVVHNGHISNDLQLKKEHTRKGYKYTTEVKQVWKSGDKEIAVEQDIEWNDSESLAIELAHDLDGLQNGLGSVQGSIAFIALQVDKKTAKAVKLFYGRNYLSPLVVEQTEHYFVISSMGQGTEVVPNTLFYLDYETLEIFQKKEYKIGQSYYEHEYKYSKWNQHQDKIGFKSPDKKIETNITKAVKTYDEFETLDFDDYYELLAEEDELNEMLTRHDIEHNERVEWQAELINIRSKMKKYEDQYDHKGNDKGL